MDLDEYLEYLKTIDVGLIANDNSGLLTVLARKYSPIDARISVAMTDGARIERICSNDEQRQDQPGCSGLVE